MKVAIVILALILAGCSTPQPVKLVCSGPCAMTTDGSNVDLPKVGAILLPGVPK